MKRKILSILVPAVIACNTFFAPVQPVFFPGSITAEAASIVSAPKAGKSSGSYYCSGSFKLTLKSSTTGAQIYYSLNGSSYKKYNTAISITKSSTIKCYAIKDGLRSSNKIYTYKLLPKVTISSDEGSSPKNLTVYLSSKVPGVKFYYTLNGKKPTKSSSLYTANGINIEKTATLRIMATKAGWENRYITKKYVIDSNDASDKKAGIVDDYTSKWGYNTLNSVQKKGYAAIFKSTKNHADSADVDGMGIKVSDMEKLYWAFDFDNPQFFWMGNGYSYSYSPLSKEVVTISITYSRTASEAEKIKTKLEKASEEIISEALKYNDTAEQIKVIHDSLINMTKYSTNKTDCCYEADGPLVYGKAVCEGYSKAFEYLCQSIGIDCICLSGKAGGGDHMWNMVKIDGSWYHIDITWDDPIVSYGSELRYNYFLISEKEMLKDHRISNEFELPSATKNYG